MSFFDSLYIASFMLAIVFAVLFVLFLCIRISSVVFEKIDSKKKKNNKTSA